MLSLFFLCAVVGRFSLLLLLLLLLLVVLVLLRPFFSKVFGGFSCFRLVWARVGWCG